MQNNWTGHEEQIMPQLKKLEPSLLLTVAVTTFAWAGFPYAVVASCDIPGKQAAGNVSGSALAAGNVSGPALAVENVQEKIDDEVEESKNGFDKSANMASFDKVWETIDNTHWDEDLVGQSWDDAKAKYRPQAEKATSIKEIRAAMEGLINELGQSHFGIIPASSYDVVDGSGGGNADTGLTFRAVGDEILVTKIRRDSPGDKAGVKTGWAATRIRDKDVTEISKKVRAAAHGPIRYETLAALAVAKKTSGNTGDKIKLVMTDDKGETRELELELEVPAGTTAPVFGNLPPIRVTLESKTLEDNIGYFAFSAFFDPMRIMPAFRKMLQDENHTNGIVIDLRGNIGGIAGMTMGMASALSDSSSELGVMRMKGTKLKFAVNEAADPVTCPVAILIDECSISSAEILSGGLQDIGIGKVFGGRSAGLALPSTVIKLPNGDGFQFAIADYKSASGKSLEMDGVTPDEPVDLSKELLLRDSDPVLNRALQWIKQQNENK